MNKELSANTNLAYYRIVAPIGAGGMGKVYLAEDTRLDRKVAIKLLEEEFNTNEDRLRRFIGEAKAASALNHPSILTVYDIGKTESGTHFIATEYIEGETLRHYIQHSRLKLREVLDILVQVASALSTAHQAGIIHRDIKPENVMLRPDGIVKVLDFGLAKLNEKPMPATDSAAPTISRKATDPGTVMGTVQYMSPEQARGKEVDGRSDIFSLGIVLYEMIAGQVPFMGESSTDVLAAILDKEPMPLLRFVNEVPQELQRIVSKCLRKERDERYQTMKDVLLDLKGLREELAMEAKLERSIRLTSQSAENQQTLIADGELTKEAVGQSTAVATVQTTSSAEYLVSQIQRHKRGFTVALLVVLLTVLGLGYWLFFLRGATKEIESIAVLPFVDASGNADVEYLSDGMTETLISSLSSLPNLNVKPRSSVFRYKGKETNPQTIAKELKVDAILNGRVVQRGQDVSLFVELIDVALDRVVWSQQYNRKQNDLVTLQTDIARDVSSKLKTKLSGADEAKVTKTYTTNPEAYQLYLKGKYYYSKYNENSYQKAIEYYKQAIGIDPNYVLAYVGIAYSYNTANDWYLPPNEAMPKAKAAALKALELDDTLADAHYILGVIAFWYDWDWVTVEREMKRGMELDSSNMMYGLYLSAMGKHDEAIKEREMSQRRFPFDLQISMDLEGVYLYAGRYDQVIDQARKTMELDQNYWGAYQDLGLAYERKRQYAEAIAALEKAGSLDSNPSILGYLGYVYAAAGKNAEAQRVLSQLKELSKHRHVSPYSIAIIYAGLNDKDQAFDWLNKAYDSRSFFMTLLKVETVLDNLRPDPRYKDLLKRMGLPE